MKTHPYYKFDRIMSFNAFWNFICGARGLGKTFGAKERAINAALKKGDQFIYLRRYKTELAPARATFFDDLKARGKFEDWDFKYSGPEALAAPVSTRDDKKREWKVIGFFIALSTAQTQKSVSFPNVKTIIYDEFIIEKGNVSYLPNEDVVFTNFYSTVDRYQDKTKVYFLANSVSIMNPYFIKYGIRPDEGNEFVKAGGGYVIAHFPDAKDFQASVYTTSFGKFIQDTDYADYAVGNDFGDNHDSLIGRKTPKAKYYFSLETLKGTFSVWRESATDEYYIQSKLPKSERLFTLVPANMSSEKQLMTYNDKLLSYLKTAFRSARVTFDQPSTRNTFAEIFTRR